MLYFHGRNRKLRGARLPLSWATVYLSRYVLILSASPLPLLSREIRLLSVLNSLIFFTVLIRYIFAVNYDLLLAVIVPFIILVIL